MKRFILAGAATVALMCSATASADVDIGVSIGIPGVIWGAPPVVVAERPRYYYPPVRYVQRPPVVVVQEPRYKWRGHERHGHYWGGHYDKGHHRWHKDHGNRHGHHH